MRKIRSSGKALATASLMAAELARSLPSGFSRLIRAPSPARPAAASPSIVGLNRLGAVDRKIARFSPGPAFSASLA